MNTNSSITMGMSPAYTHPSELMIILFIYIRTLTRLRILLTSVILSSTQNAPVSRVWLNASNPRTQPLQNVSTLHAGVQMSYDMLPTVDQSAAICTLFEPA